MAVPKRRTSRMKRDQRRAHHDKVSAPELVEAQYEGQIVVVPKRMAKALPYLTRRELKKLGGGAMKVVNSLKSAKKRHADCRVVRRRGRVYVICKSNPRFKARQGGGRKKK